MGQEAIHNSVQKLPEITYFVYLTTFQRFQTKGRPNQIKTDKYSYPIPVERFCTILDYDLVLCKPSMGNPEMVSDIQSALYEYIFSIYWAK